MAPTPPATHRQSRQPAAPSFAARHGVQSTRANAIADGLVSNIHLSKRRKAQISLHLVQRSARISAASQLNRLDAMEQLVRNLGATYANGLSIETAKVEDLEAKNNRLEAENRTLKQGAELSGRATAGMSREDDNDYLELQLGASSTQHFVDELEDKVKGLELQLREEKERWAANISAEAKLAAIRKRWEEMANMIAGEHGAIVEMIDPIFKEE